MYILNNVVTGCSTPGLSKVLLILKNILNLVQIIGPILLIISLVITFTKLAKDPEEKKYIKSIKNSVLGIFFLFLVPVLVNSFMALSDNSIDVSRCWNAIADTKTNAQYIKTTDRELSPLLVNPDDYEKGEKRKPENDPNGGSSIEGTAMSYKDVVYDPNNVTKISNLTSAQLVKILNAYGSGANNFVPYASNYITAENKYHVNVFFLIGLNALESGWGTSAIARGCNNLGGVCQSPSHPSNGCGSNSNCAFAKFNSLGDFIDYNASMLNNNYLTPGGSYYEGTSLTQVYTKHYCPGCTEAAGSINTIATGLFNKAKTVM